MDGLQRVTLDHTAVNLNIGDLDVRNLLAQRGRLGGVNTEQGAEFGGGVDASVRGQRFDDGVHERSVLSVLCGGTSGGGLIQLAQGFGGVDDGIVRDVVQRDIGEKFLVRHSGLFISFLAVGRNPYLYLTDIPYHIFFILSTVFIRCLTSKYKPRDYTW